MTDNVAMHSRVLKLPRIPLDVFLKDRKKFDTAYLFKPSKEEMAEMLERFDEYLDDRRNSDKTS